MRTLHRLLPAVFAAAVSLLLSGCTSHDRADDRLSDTTGQTAQVFHDSLIIELDGVDSTTVLDLLLAHHQVDYRSTAAGAFVTAINGAESAADWFWVYSVNDTFPSTACDRYLTSSGDRVRWHFRKGRR